MNNASRNRNHPDHQLEQQILKTDLCHSVINDIQELVVNYAADFDLDFLPTRCDYGRPNVPLLDAISELYNRTRLLFKKSKIDFDNHWVRYLIDLDRCHGNQLINRQLHDLELDCTVETSNLL